nr:plasmid mobilization relaxosome protein MobC [Gemmiger formicilis]
MHRAPGCGSVSGRKRRHIVPIRLTEKELRHLNRQSNLSGLSREGYIRALILGAELHPRPCTHHADLLRKVAGLCNNANQLAHRANSTGVAGQESVDRMTALAAEIYRLVKENW